LWEIRHLARTLPGRQSLTGGVAKHLVGATVTESGLKHSASPEPVQLRPKLSGRQPRFHESEVVDNLPPRHTRVAWVVRLAVPFGAVDRRDHLFIRDGLEPPQPGFRLPSLSPF